MSLTLQRVSCTVMCVPHGCPQHSCVLAHVPDPMCIEAGGGHIDQDRCLLCVVSSVC